MRKVYVYLLNTTADWEIGHICAELNSRRFFKKDAEEISLKYVSASKETVRTMGGLTVTPDCLADDISIDEKTVLILPGADTWNDESNNKVLEKSVEILNANGTIIVTDPKRRTIARLWLFIEEKRLYNKSS